MLLQIGPESRVLESNGVLSNMRQTEERQGSTEDTPGGTDVEGILRRQLHALATRGNYVGKHPGADKSTDLANGGSDAVVPTTNTGGARLGGDKADVIARSQLAQRQEDAVDDGEGADHAGLAEAAVAPRHDEADDSLERDAKRKRVPGSELVGKGGAEHGAGDIEEVDDRVPAEDGGQWGRVRIEDVGQDSGRVDAEGIRREIVDEPDQTDDEEAGAVESQDQEVGGLGVFHGVAGEFFGLLEA